MFKVIVIGAGLILSLGAGASAQSTQPANLMKDVKRIIFAGDSLTDGSAWCDWVIETLEQNGHPNLIMHNAASRATGFSFSRRAGSMTFGPQAGSCDHQTSTTNNREPAEKIQGDLDEMLAAARKAGAKVVIMIPPGVTEPKHQAILDGYVPMIQSWRNRTTAPCSTCTQRS